MNLTFGVHLTSFSEIRPQKVADSHPIPSDIPDELVKALKGLGRGPDGKWVFDETKVKRVLKKMGREARGRL